MLTPAQLALLERIEHGIIMIRSEIQDVKDRLRCHERIMDMLIDNTKKVEPTPTKWWSFLYK